MVWWCGGVLCLRRALSFSSFSCFFPPIRSDAGRFGVGLDCHPLPYSFGVASLSVSQVSTVERSWSRGLEVRWLALKRYFASMGRRTDGYIMTLLIT